MHYLNDNAFRPMPSFAHAIYFWFSLFFLIARTLALSLYAASIHDESKKPIDVLRAVPHYSWCTEVRRFGEEVVNNTVALSGMRFFFLTRKLILSVSCLNDSIVIGICDFFHFFKLGCRHNRYIWAGLFMNIETKQEIEIIFKKIFLQVLIQFHTDDEKPTLCNGIDRAS